MMTNHNPSASNDPTLQLAQASGRSRLWLFLLCPVLPLAITLGALVAAAHGIGAPPGAEPRLVHGSWPLTYAFTLGMVGAIVVPLWLILDRLMRRQALVLGDGILDVRSTLYRNHVPLPELDLDRARVVDLDEHTELRPGMKLNGFSIPGFRSGWFFRIRDRRKTFVAVADGRRKLWLPTHGNHDLLLEPRDPQRLLDRLREQAGRPAR